MRPAGWNVCYDTDQKTTHVVSHTVPHSNLAECDP